MRYTYIVKDSGFDNMKMMVTISIECDLVQEVDMFLELQKKITKSKISRSAFIEEATSKYLLIRKHELSELDDRGHGTKRSRDASVVQH